MNRQVEFIPGLVLAFGENIDAQPHQHNLWQICFSQQVFWLNGERLSQQVVVIPPKALHLLNMPQGGVILAEPQSHFGLMLAKVPKVWQLETTEVSWESALAAQPELSEAFSSGQQLRPKHPKILKLLQQLDLCLISTCLKPDQWRASDIAQQLGLSESRFLHLISAELGMPWRPYLLWRRLICAMQSIKRGNNATQAAHGAGFTDSAHLSRTIKSTFGMTSKQVIKSFR